MAVADQKIVVVGLGYVGLPLAVQLAKHYPTIGLDIDQGRIAELHKGHDRTREVDAEALDASSLVLTADPSEAADADVYIVTVPTPVDDANRPDLSPVMSATRTVASLLKPGRAHVIVYESTVYPGVTEDMCGPELEARSGLKRGTDFFLGYSPERINPGDREHTVDRIIKVVAGENPEITERIAQIYDKVTSAGAFRAASIKAAEAAKVIENAQRDINIAFMNEITQIFARLDISIWDVLEAAGTKWNFLKFQPGLVGGHCIGVDPYYLSHCAQSVGHLPRVILAGRSINDSMAGWVADAIHTKRHSKIGSVLMLGVTFKEDVPDLRNSKVFDVVKRLRWLGHRVTLHDPLADPVEARHEYGVGLSSDALSGRYDVVVGAVPHADYKGLDPALINDLVEPNGLVADIKGMWSGKVLRPDVERWTL
ncbi:nucleotide sugar dehydrogenase [Sphingomonas montanisoli]|uniref:Nucleotide sugar dehydrogenase n=1 Tax=Sphingomonas montanisoli TaxID=2606412 RepID=A0A5D9CDL5_9SPHN|nr:nucleotide sugar dehydrogenase [Sphingomonas montanisoli]TZG29272.1 nucleotide sugar dehydrogenase [Sphingomonas montanisoli]